jgi:hypothetical protein
MCPGSESTAAGCVPADAGTGDGEQVCLLRRLAGGVSGQAHLQRALPPAALPSLAPDLVKYAPTATHSPFAWQLTAERCAPEFFFAALPGGRTRAARARQPDRHSSQQPRIYPGLWPPGTLPTRQARPGPAR